jgi:nucleoside-diphosphate-sugar epimerase
MYMPDAMINTIKMMYQEKVEKRIYNFMAYSISPGEIESIIKERIPDFHVEYVPDYRQAIADSWPASINIEDSVKDWGFDCTYDAKKTVEDMLDHYSST